MKWLVLVIFIVVVFLLFYNLGGEFLWFDESAIAALGENVLEFGYPKGLYNGVPVWSHYGYRPGYAYISRPWLEIYVAALGRLVFGKTNFAVRIFFAFFGFVCFVLVYFLSKRLFKDNRAITVSSLLLLASSTPFLLQMRQCAYYSLVSFATLWIIWAYLDLLEVKKHSFILFFSSSVFLLFANHGIFLMVFVGVLLHYIVFSRRKEVKKYIASVIFLLFPIFIFVVWYFKGFTHFEPSLLNQIYPNINYYIRAVNKYVLPYRFYFVVFLCVFLLKRKRIIGILQKEKENWAGFYLFGCIILASLAMLAFERHRYFRYIVNWIPLLAIMHAYIFSKFLKWNKFFAVTLFFLIIFTNILHESGSYIILNAVKPVSDKKAVIKRYFPDYIYEITHKYEGPIAAIVTYLNKNAKKTDTFKTPYNVTGIMYYTGLVGSKDFSEETYPEWIILRRDWIGPEFYNSRYYKNITRMYEAIKLYAFDIPWENRPDDMEYHKFRTPKEGPPLVIFKRG